MVVDAYLVSPGSIGPLCRPGSAQQVRVCDMWRRAVTCLLACHLTSLDCRDFTRKTVRPRAGFAGPTTSTRTRSRWEEAGRGACPPPANDLSLRFAGSIQQGTPGSRLPSCARRTGGDSRSKSRSMLEGLLRVHAGFCAPSAAEAFSSAPRTNVRRGSTTTSSLG